MLLGGALMVTCGCRQKRGRFYVQDGIYPIESLKTSLLQRVAQAVGASADLLADLRAENEPSR
jgi:hypothetical protein